MTTIVDEDFEKAIREALAAEPALAEKTIKLMVEGCKQMERFEEALETARKAPYVDANPKRHEAALYEARAAFGTLIDIFGTLLAIATGAEVDGDN